MQKRKTVYLTIDDSPSGDFREKINFLDAHNIPAVLFCVGEYLEAAPGTVVDAIKKGYVIGNHSYSHPRFSEISFPRARNEITKTDRVIEEIYSRAGIERPAKVFRFPYGDKGWKKRMNTDFKPFIPSKMKKPVNHFLGGRHKKRIQDFLAAQGYSHPAVDGITYPFYHELKLMEDHDLFWTFDFCEYKKRSAPEIYSLMQQKENWDTINSNRYKIGSLTDYSSDDILLIHDHTETTEVFYQIINRCLKLNLNFQPLF